MARIPGYEVTVLHSGKPISKKDSGFREMVVPETSLFGFLWQRRVLAITRHYDVVVALFDVHYLSTIILALLPRTFKLIFWGIGFGASRVANKIRTFLARRAEALAFYMPGNISNFDRAGVSEDCVFCVRNTIHIENPFFSSDVSSKNCFLFIGSLTPRKLVDELVEAFARIVDRCPSKIMLEIIGDGDMRDSLQSLVSKLKLEKFVRFNGVITDEALLALFFKRAIAMISPGQAGLSILHSFACGVPVITKKNAISGGELENVLDGENGVLYNGSVNELSEILLRMAMDPIYALNLGHNAYEYYTKSMTLNHSVREFERAIEFVRFPKGGGSGK